VKVHHVGIVVHNEQVARELMESLELKEDYRGYVAEYQSLCIFSQKEDGSVVEFVVPSGGTLATYNNGKGGIHHIAFEVDDIGAHKRRLEAKGVRFLEDKPVKGAGDFVVNFVRPRSLGGILVEFVQLI